jgi:HlyD family secretion protein
MRKFILGFIIIAIIGGGVAGFLWWQQQQEAQTVPEVLKTETAAYGDLVVSVAASGNVAVKETTDLYTRANGKVAEVLVAPNERVTAEQVLAKLDTDQLERAVHQAEVALEQALLNLETELEPADPEEIELAEVALSNAAKALEVARLAEETARVDADAMVVQAQRDREQAFNRYRDADDSKESAKEALEDAETQERIARTNAALTIQQARSQRQAAYTRYEQAQRNLDVLQEGPDENKIRQLELQVEQAELSLEQAQRNLGNAQIVAPYAGIIGAVFLEVETEQQIGEKAFTLIDDAAYYVDVTIDEIDIASIVTDQPVEVTLDAFPDVELEGRVQTIAPASTDEGGLIAYQVQLIISNPDRVRILDGMTASVRIDTNTIEDVLLVPNWAVRIDQASAEAFCYIMEEGIPQRTNVEIGRRNENYTEILSGLQSGDTVALVVEEREPLPLEGPPPNN